MKWFGVLCVTKKYSDKGSEKMQRKLLTNGNRNLKLMMCRMQRLKIGSIRYEIEGILHCDVCPDGQVMLFAYAHSDVFASQKWCDVFHSLAVGEHHAVRHITHEVYITFRKEHIIEKSTSQMRSAFFVAGAEGFEPSARGFGDHCSTNWAIPLYWYTANELWQYTTFFIVCKDFFENFIFEWLLF